MQPPGPNPPHSTTHNFAVKTNPPHSPTQTIVATKTLSSSFTNPKLCSQDPTILIGQPKPLQPPIPNPSHSPTQHTAAKPSSSHSLTQPTAAIKTQPSSFNKQNHYNHKDPTLLIDEPNPLQLTRPNPSHSATQSTTATKTQPSSSTYPTHCSHQHPILLYPELKLLQPPRPNPPHSAIQSHQDTPIIHEHNPLLPLRPNPPHSRTQPIAAKTQPSSFTTQPIAATKTQSSSFNSPKKYSYQDTTIFIHELNPLQPPRHSLPHSTAIRTTATKTKPSSFTNQPVAATKTPHQFNNPTDCSHQDPILFIH